MIIQKLSFILLRSIRNMLQNLSSSEYTYYASILVPLLLKKRIILKKIISSFLHHMSITDDTQMIIPSAFSKRIPWIKWPMIAKCSCDAVKITRKTNRVNKVEQFLVHTTYSQYIKGQKCARMGLNGFHIRQIFGTQDNWKNENPGSPLGAAS